MHIASKDHPLIKLESKYTAHNYEPIPVVLSHGKGVWFWDDLGNRYLDMMSAYSAASHGHAHSRILVTLNEQASRLCVASRAYYNDRLGAFMQKVCEVTGLDKALPMNTGAEAVETAIKAARRWGYWEKKIPENQAEIIVAEGNFHGRTTTIVGFSTSEKNRDGFGPFAPGFKAVPFGDVKAVEQAINKNTCCVLLEPIQGEAGIIIPPEGYLTEVAALCKKNNVLFFLDEIQSGLGRTGKMFAYQHENLLPDGVMLGKALGGGVLPVSALVGKKHVMDLFTPGCHGSTFGGSPLAAAVGLEALKILESERLVERSATLGAYLLEELQKIDHPYIVGVRGRGLWCGIDINIELMSGYDFCTKLAENGVLTKETRERTIRFAPPFVITKKEIDWGLEQLKKTLALVV
jgi:ornithine--oxo-acid transaminase